MDFIIADATPYLCKNVYYFETKLRQTPGLRRNASILSDELGEFFPNAVERGRYIIYTGDTYFAYLNGKELIFVPFGSELTDQYEFFDHHILQLQQEGRIYPQTPENPYYIARH